MSEYCGSCKHLSEKIGSIEYQLEEAVNLLKIVDEIAEDKEPDMDGDVFHALVKKFLRDNI